MFTIHRTVQNLGSIPHISYILFYVDFLSSTLYHVLIFVTYRLDIHNTVYKILHQEIRLRLQKGNSSTMQHFKCGLIFIM